MAAIYCNKEHLILVSLSTCILHGKQFTILSGELRDIFPFFIIVKKIA